MKNFEEIKEMTNEEIKEALKELKKVIKLGIIKSDHADPIAEGVYTSSSDFAGVFFPNSILYDATYTERRSACWAPVALCKRQKNGGFSYGLMYDLTEKGASDEIYKKLYIDTKIDPRYFVSFYEMTYTSEERQTLEALNANIEECKKDLKILNNIKFITKKDGQPFANLTKNIEEHPIKNITFSVSYDEYIEQLKIYNSETHTGTDTDGNYFNFNTYHNIIIYQVKDLETLKENIKKYIISISKNLAEYETDKKNIKKLFSIKRDFENKIKNYNITYTTAENIKKSLTLK